MKLRGFLLIEAIIYLGITIILSSTLFLIMKTMNSLQHKNNNNIPYANIIKFIKTDKELVKRIKQEDIKTLLNNIKMFHTNNITCFGSNDFRSKLTKNTQNIEITYSNGQVIITQNNEIKHKLDGEYFVQYIHDIIKQDNDTE